MKGTMKFILQLLCSIYATSGSIVNSPVFPATKLNLVEQSTPNTLGKVIDQVLNSTTVKKTEKPYESEDGSSPRRGDWQRFMAGRKDYLNLEPEIEFQSTNRTQRQMDPTFVWSYANQPQWPVQYAADCAGMFQSPINLRTVSSTESRSTTCLQWTYYGFPPQILMSTVDKHTVNVGTAWNPTPTLQGGPLLEAYKLSGIHFHWGFDDTDGSEHAINSRKYSMELHAVHYKSKFATIAAAITSRERDALTVVAVLYQGSLASTTSMGYLIRRLQQGLANDQPLYLTDFGMGFIKNYYSYLGSLTTPPCSQVVRWIVSANIRYVRRADLDVLRSLTYQGTSLTENYRTIQPLNGRSIEHYARC